jgi:hypothetical protein
MFVAVDADLNTVASHFDFAFPARRARQECRVGGRQMERSKSAK